MGVDAFRPLLPFDTDDESFARGFEAGRLWTLLRENPDQEYEEYASAANAEMVLRIAEATRREVKSEELGDGWLLVSFSATELQESP